MAVKVELFPAQLSYFPGDIVSAFVQVINEFPSATGPQSTVHVSEVVVEAFGLERVDPNWISILYQPDAPFHTKDSRKVVRRTFGTEPTRLVQRALLPAGAAPMFLIKFRLPMRLPCTFKGSSVRFSYHIQAKVTYRIAVADDTSPTSSLPASPTTSRRHTSDAMLPPETKQETTTAEAAFTVWPSLLPSHDKHLARTSSSTAPAGTPDIELPLQDYNVGGSLSKIMWEGLSGPEVAMIMAPSRKTSASSSPALKHRYSGTSAFRDSDVETILNHISDSDADSTVVESKGTPHSPSSHTPRSSYIVRALTSFRSYNLRVGEDTLLKFTLQPPLQGVLEPGNTFGGVLDFRRCMENTLLGAAAPHCMYITVLLETEEVISTDCKPPGRGLQPAVIRKLYSEQQELTADSVLTYFHFTIPASAPPSFRTPMVSLQWVLRFEILTAVVNVNDSSGRRSIKPMPDSLLWSLPLVVHPPLART